MSAELGLPTKRRIGRYDLLLPLGRGGMATVYLATTNGFGGFRREVALKLSHPHLAGDSEYLESLKQEATIGSRIRHPNVVQVEDIDAVEDGVFLVMDYVEGVSLDALAKSIAAGGEKFPLAEAVEIMIQALTGLHAAHELTDAAGEPLQVVHRDFTPQNILIGRDGRVRLTDFGIAKARRGQETRSGIVKGKVRYMSPEQVQGNPIDRRTDVWAAGAILWELLAGEPLFNGKTDETATIFAIVMTDPPPISSRREVPDEITETITASLSRDRAGRIASAHDMAARLAHARSVHELTPKLAELVERFVGNELDRRGELVAERLAAVAEGQENGTTSEGSPTPNTKDEDDDTTRVAPARSLNESTPFEEPSAIHALEQPGRSPRRRRDFVLIGSTVLLSVVGTLAAMFALGGRSRGAASDLGASAAATSVEQTAEPPVPSSAVAPPGGTTSASSGPSISPSAASSFAASSTALPARGSASSTVRSHSRPRPQGTSKAGVPRLADGVYQKKP